MASTFVGKRQSFPPPITAITAPAGAQNLAFVNRPPRTQGRADVQRFLAFIPRRLASTRTAAPRIQTRLTFTRAARELIQRRLAFTRAAAGLIRRCLALIRPGTESIQSRLAFTPSGSARSRTPRAIVRTRLAFTGPVRGGAEAFGAAAAGPKFAAFRAPRRYFRPKSRRTDG